MKSWLDLSKDEQNQLKNEFKSKKKRMVDLRIPLYILSFIPFFILAALIVAKIQDFGDNETIARNMLFSGAGFAIFFLLAIINSIMLSNWEKEFAKWLKLKNIIK